MIIFYKQFWSLKAYNYNIAMIRIRDMHIMPILPISFGLFLPAAGLDWSTAFCFDLFIATYPRMFFFIATYPRMLFY